MPPDPVLHAVLRAAADVTAAGAGWLLAHDRAGDALEVAAVHSSATDAAAVLGATVPATAGTAGYVVASGQPLALSGAADDPRLAEGVPALLGRRPTTVLSVACEVGDDVVGVLELVDKAGGGSFSFDDVELATLLAGIGGVALTARGTAPAPVASPAELAADLQRLADADPTGYAAVASTLSALLARQ